MFSTPLCLTSGKASNSNHTLHLLSVTIFYSSASLHLVLWPLWEPEKGNCYLQACCFGHASLTLHLSLTPLFPCWPLPPLLACYWRRFMRRSPVPGWPQGARPSAVEPINNRRPRLRFLLCVSHNRHSRSSHMTIVETGRVAGVVAARGWHGHPNSSRAAPQSLWMWWMGRGRCYLSQGHL